VPVQLFAFDLLQLGDSDATGQSYVERRELLAGLDLSNSLVRTPPYWTDVEPAVMLDTVGDHGLEGIVSKRRPRSSLT
jgi:bifunctional non-homologous end joining protein LigD